MDRHPPVLDGPVSDGARPDETLDRRSWPSAITWIILAVAASLYAFGQVHSRFAAYDDEGFMLMTVRQFESGVALYDRMYTEYGPFYYLAYSWVFRVTHVAPTHDVMRVLTIVLWLATSAGFALCVRVHGRSMAWVAVAVCATMVVLRPLRGEPGHPQGLVLALVAGVLALALAHRRWSERVLFGAAGVALGALTLIKINVGALVGFALVTLLASARRTHRPATAWVNTVAAAALPVVLMARDFSHAGAVAQAAVWAFGLASVTYTFHRGVRPAIDAGRAFAWMATAWAATAVAVVSVVLAKGTTPRGLLEGVVLQPLRFSGAIPFQTPGLVVLLAATACAAGSATWLRRRARAGFPDVERDRVAVATGLAVTAVLFPVASPVVALPLLWFLATPTAESRDSLTPSRRLVIAVAAFGSLMAYPVPGTQAYLSASLILLASLVVLSSAGDAGLGRWPGLCLRIVTASVCLMGAWHGFVYWVVPQQPSGLPNSSLMRLAKEQRANFHTIVDLTSRRCDTLVSLPGMNSFNVWTGLPHPNGFLTSAAMVLFDTPTQATLTRDLRSAGRPCVVHHHELEVWISKFRTVPADQPFFDLVHRELVPVYAASGYDIRVPARDVAAWPARKDSSAGPSN